MVVSDNNWSTSPSLIQRVQAQEADAWQRLCDVYSPLVFSWVRKAGTQENDAEDIVQEIFRAVFRGIAKFHRDRPDDTFRGWLLTITRNEIRGWHRRCEKHVAQAEGGTEANQRIVKLAEWVESDQDSQAMLQDAVAEQELMRRAAAMVEQDFGKQTWQAFWRSTVESQAAVDVAADLGMTCGAVRQAKFRVLARLREVLE